MNFEALNKISYGLYLVTTHYEGVDYGFVGNAFMQVTAEPSQIIIASNKENHSTEIISKSKKIGIIENLNIPNDSILGFYGDVAHLDRLCEAVLIVREKNLKNNFIIKCECWP